jgi:hypothetical protein
MFHIKFGVALPLAVAAWLGVAACGDEPTPPTPTPVPGDLVVSLVSPNGGEGAAVLETGDEGIVDIAAEGSQAYLWQAGGASRIVVLLDEPGDVRFTISVEDVNEPPRLEIVEVADGDNRLRESLTGYRVVLEPVIGA